MRNLIIFLTTTVFFIAGCSSDNALVFNDYPNMKLGFTTQNFIKVEPVSVETSKKFISYARENGYSWIELRDPDASLSYKECKEIAAFANSSGIEIIYSSQRGLLDDDFMDVFSRALVNSTAFDGQKYVRVLIANTEYPAGVAKLGWTKEEFEKAVKIADKAATMAKEYGFMLAAENSNGDIDGIGKPYYGLAEFFDNTSENVKWQFDTANFFWVPQADISPKQAEDFLRKYAHRLSYLHLKTAADGKSLPVLADNPLNFEVIFPILDKAGCHYIAIELDVIEDEKQIYKNHSNSLEYLIEKGLIYRTSRCKL